jgi:glutathione S-transferase
MLTLYHHNISVCAQKVRLVLAEKELPWVGRHIDIERGEQLSPEYLKINPKGFVPALEHDGVVILESTLICEYLEDAFPDRPLRPSGAVPLARMRLWPKAVDDAMHPACGTISHAVALIPQLKTRMPVAEIEKRFAAMPDPLRRSRQLELLHKGTAAPIVQDAFRVYEKCIGEMEAALAAGPWLCGGELTLADIAVVPYLHRLERLGLSRYWRPERPRVGDWLARMRSRRSFAEAMDAFPPVGVFNDVLEGGSAELWREVERAIGN